MTLRAAVCSMSPPGPQRRFTSAQGTSAMEGKPDGPRTRPEPLLLTHNVTSSPSIDALRKDHSITSRGAHYRMRPALSRPNVRTALTVDLASK
jgi:hypothetical protein